VYVTLNNETDATEVVADQLTGRDEAMFVARAFHAVLKTLDPSFMSYGQWCQSLNAVAFGKADLWELKKALGVNHMFLVADEVARAPNTERALSALCRLGDAEPTFPVTVLASCYKPSLAVNMSTKSRRSLVAIPTVLAPDVKFVPAVRDHDLLCRYYVLCGGHMRSAARLLRAGNEGSTELAVDAAIDAVKVTAKDFAAELCRNGEAAPDKMVLGIAAALCGVPFEEFQIKITDEQIREAVSVLYGATNNMARGVKAARLLATLDGICARVKRWSPEATRTAVTEAARLFDEWNMTDATGVFDVLKHAVSRQVCAVYVGFNNAMNQTAQEEEQIRTPRKAAEVILRRVLLRLEEALAAVETPEQRFCARDKHTLVGARVEGRGSRCWRRAWAAAVPRRLRRYFAARPTESVGRTSCC